MKKILLLIMISLLGIVSSCGITKNADITAASLDNVLDSTTIEEEVLAKLNEIKDWNGRICAMIQDLNFYGKYGTSTIGEDMNIKERTSRYKDEIVKLNDYDTYMESLDEVNFQKLKFVFSKLSASLHRTDDIIQNHTLDAYTFLDLDTLDLVQYGFAFDSKVASYQ